MTVLLLDGKLVLFIKGEFGRLPQADGKNIRYSGISIVRLANGKVFEEIGEEDRLNIVQQCSS